MFFLLLSRLNGGKVVQKIIDKNQNFNIFLRLIGDKKHIFISLVLFCANFNYYIVLFFTFFYFQIAGVSLVELQEHKKTTKTFYMWRQFL